MMKYDLVIAHRVCPAFSKTAVGFESKFDMVCAAARSMAAALREAGNLRLKIFVILDACPGEYEAMFREVFSSFELEIVNEDGAGNLSTWATQIDLLTGVSAEYVYFSEDDYIYAPEAFSAMLEMMSVADFVTPIDHPDRYNTVIEQSFETTVVATPARHWRRVGSTCLTFMTSGSTLGKTAAVMRSYSSGVVDSSMWLALTADRVFSLPSLFRSFFAALGRLIGLPVHSGRYMPLFAWKDFGLKLLFYRRYSLWSPMPELARHLFRDTIPVTKAVRSGLS